MTRPMTALAAASLALALVACADAAPGQQQTRPARPPPVALLGENLLLLPGAEGPLRVAFDPAEPAADVLVGDPPDAPTVTICPLPALDAALPPLADCVTAAAGVRERVTSDQELRAVAILSRARDVATIDLRLEYAERSREIAVRLPLIRRPSGVTDCSDNACNPFFELVPTRAGRLRASASWTGGEALLQVLSGRVLGRSFSATGVPYGVPAGASGEPPLAVRANLSAPGEYALALAQTGPGELRDVLIRATWPGA